MFLSVFRNVHTLTVYKCETQYHYKKKKMYFTKQVIFFKKTQKKKKKRGSIQQMYVREL